MHFSETEPKHILNWIKKKDKGDDTYYIKGKEDTQEAIGVFRSLYDKKYEDVLQLFNYLRKSLKLRKADSNSLYRAFISLYYNDDIINIRLSRHFSTEHSLQWSINAKGKPDMEYHLVIDKEQTGSTENTISKDTTYNGVKIKVMDIDLNKFNNEIIDEIILLLTYGTTKKPSTNISVDSGGNYVSANGWGADYVSESRLRNIIRESIDTLLLTESQESKSISAAKKLVMQRLGYDEQEADEFIRVKLRGKLSSLKTDEGGKFILGVTRMICNNELVLDDWVNVSKLNRVLDYISKNCIDFYDRNLNGCTPQMIIDRFSDELETILNNDKEKLNKKTFKTNNGYTIDPINEFDDGWRKGYNRYTDWCILESEEDWEYYTSGGLNQVYFCSKDGYRSIPRVKGQNYPNDEYGLSLFAIIVRQDGSLYVYQSRWNYGDEGEADIDKDTDEISELIGANFYEVFKPKESNWFATNESISKYDRIISESIRKTLYKLL